MAGSEWGINCPEEVMLVALLAEIRGELRDSKNTMCETGRHPAGKKKGGGDPTRGEMEAQIRSGEKQLTTARRPHGR